MRFFCAAIDKVYCDFIDKNGSNFDVIDLENIEVQIQKKYYFYCTQTNMHDQATLYKKILSKIEKIISNKYQSIYSSSFDIIRASLCSLDGRFIRNYINQIQYAERKDSVFKIYDFWLNKLCGYAPPASIIRDVEIAELAHKKTFNLFLERYFKTLQSYQKNLFSSWTLLKSNLLKAHMERVKKEYQVIQEELFNSHNDFSPFIQKIVVIQNEILNFLNHHQKDHSSQNLSILKSHRKQILADVKELKNISGTIESCIIKNHTFEENLFLAFTSLLSDLRNKINTAENNLIELEKIYTQNHSDYKAWVAKKMLFENTLQYANSTLDKIEKNEYHSFMLYSKINLHAVNDLYFDNPKYYGTSLLLSIKKGDILFAEKIIAEHGTEIHIQHLAAALNLALKNDLDSLFIKIYKARKNISFSNALLLDIVSESISLNRLHFAIPILLDSTIELDKKTSLLLRQSSLSQKDLLLPIEKNFFQFFFDTDAPFLEELRRCYTIEYALLLHLKTEYNALKLQKNVDDEHLIAFYNKMDSASTIGQTLLSLYLESHPFELTDPIRKEKHVKMWSSQIDELKAHYTNGLPNTLTSALYLKDFLRIKQEIFNVIDHAKHSTEIFLHLEEVKHFLKQQNNDQFFHMLSESIIHAVGHDRLEALDILLSYVEEPKLKSELAYNAFCQALFSLKPQCLQYLLRMNAYEYDINDAFIELSKLYYFSKDNPSYAQKTLAKSLLIEALTTIPLRFDPLINEFINYLAQIDDTHITASLHADLALTKVRNLYIFCEQAYHQIYDLHTEFENKFENSSKTTEQVRLHQAHAAHQINVIRKLKESAIKSVFEEVTSSAYQKAQMALWEDELKKILEECIERFNAENNPPSSSASDFDKISTG